MVSPGWPGNLSVSARVTRCPSCMVLRGHLSLSDVAVGMVGHFGAISRTESSLGQKGHLSVSRWLSVPHFMAGRLSGFWYILGASLRLNPWIHSQKLEHFHTAKGLAPGQTGEPQKMAFEWHTSFCQEEVKDSGFPYIQSFMTLSQNPDLRDSCCMCLSVAPLSPVPLCLSRSDFLATPTRLFISTWSLGKHSELPLGPGLSAIFKSLKDQKLS